MNRMAKIAALLVALTAAFSYSQDSLATHKLNPDSLTVALLKESQTFYSTSFNNLLILISLIIALIAIVVTLIGYLGFSTKKNINKINKKIKKAKKDLENNCTKLYGEIEYTYFSLAISSFDNDKDNDKIEHFRRLAEHFYILTAYKLIPENIDLKRLENFDNWIGNYNGDGIEAAKIFLYELDRFIKYGDAEYSKDATKIESAYLIKSKEIWEKLCTKFGGKKKVLDTIENFNYNTYNYSNSKRK